MVTCSLCGKQVSIDDVCSTLACRACHKALTFEECTGRGELGPNEFRCDNCGLVFTKGRSDAEAQQEAATHFGALLDDAPAVVCDDCYTKIMAWAEPPGSN